MSLQDQLKQFRKSLDGQYSGQLPKAATHIEQDLLAIIGEDVPSEQVITNRPFFHGINFTKQELRTAITAYCKGGTK